MKGIIFTEMVRFLEARFGEHEADTILVEANLPNGGAFTSVGTYPSAQALAVVGVASRRSGMDVAAICEAYGRFLYDRFGDLYPEIVERYGSAQELLAHVGSHIHEEVRILYPDARPPSVTTTIEGTDTVIRYASHRPFAMIAVGLVRRALEADNDRRVLEIEVAPGGTQAVLRLHARQADR